MCGRPWHSDQKGWALLLLLLLLAGASCASPPAPSRPIVLCSVLPQAWFLERLAGDAVQVEVMIPPGASPATYEPSIEQMRAAARASLYVKVGHPGFAFEKTWLAPILEQGRDLRVVDSSAGLEVVEGDPHLWVSPACARGMARSMAAALEEVAPSEGARFRENLAAVLAEIDEVDRELHQVLDGRAGARFYVFHPAWGYLAREFGLVQVAVEEMGREPSAGQLSRLLEQGRREGVRVIFVQPQFSKQAAQVLAKDLGARIVEMDPLDRDWPGMLRRFAQAFQESR